EKHWADLDLAARRRRINTLRGDILALERPEVIVQKHLAYAVGILARPLGMRRDELRDKIESSKATWLPIAKDLPQDVVDRLRETVAEHWIQGFEFENSIKRWYTARDLAAHVIGF